ncbi:phytanoyl-CoA dioxygenase [Sphingomonas gilva]|uniref:Phytanoyl-CoA dioxygenase n=1 Tax=Sphingomonas gilva TaxID=2305907 RepID=A0A396RN72_9SPHN|nr:phytanoyl-CoA dioxygenase family protein [Sphingomonas gilva]RHW17904.1 phytanoyl-CoA dioxygenase [Sphingomonas gilva]
MGQHPMIDPSGAELHAGAALACLDAIDRVAGEQDAARAGSRLTGITVLSDLLQADGPIGRIAVRHLHASRPVRAILFDKSATTNWALGWHQDRTIAVAKRIHVDGFGPWTVKQGLLHVEPPFAVIESMVTLRVHLDPVDADNAPLLVAPGSHRLGRIEEARIGGIVKHCGTITCLADRGDVWAYATPILHASARAERPRRRRVLQIDYAAGALPGRLEWLGV